MTKPQQLLILRYPYAVRILAAASQVDLVLERVPQEALDDHEVAVIRIGHGDETHHVLVDNEYGDADKGHRALLLSLVLMALKEFREEPGFEIWCRHNFVDPELPGLGDLYAKLGPANEALMPRFGDLEAPDPYEWSVNSDGAQALRRIAAGEF